MPRTTTRPGPGRPVSAAPRRRPASLRLEKRTASTVPARAGDPPPWGGGLAASAGGAGPADRDTLHSADDGGGAAGTVPTGRHHWSAGPRPRGSDHHHRLVRRVASVHQPGRRRHRAPADETGPGRGHGVGPRRRRRPRRGAGPDPEQARSVRGCAGGGRPVGARPATSLRRPAPALHRNRPRLSGARRGGAEGSDGRGPPVLPGPAPGPAGLSLAPTATRLAATPYFVMHRFGIERRRADTMRRAAAVAGRLERGAALDPVAARARLEAVPGVGPWTSAEVVRRSHGDGDSLSVGDYHHAADVCFALAGEQDGTDARMLELLEPYRPHRARVVLLLAAGGVRRPRRAPRARLRRIAAI